MRVSRTDVPIAVDVHDDFHTGGAPAAPGGEKIIPAINPIAGKFESNVVTQDWHPDDHISFAPNDPHKRPCKTIGLSYGSQALWPHHCVQGSAGAAFHGALETTRASQMLRKSIHRDIDPHSQSPSPG
jgi:nicotinamidase/pyrazinamidase